MRAGSIIVACVGVAIAGGSVWFAQGQLGKQAQASVPAPIIQQIETTPIWVAAADLPLGAPITQDVLRAIDFPTAALPKGAVSDIAVLLGDESKADMPRRTRQRFVEGEMMLATKLGDFGEDVSLIQKLGTNTRAMAIKVDAVTSVGGFVSPGDFVDIVLTQGSGANLRAATILQSVRVIGVDQNVNEGQGGANVARTITVEVTPRDGQRLALGQKAGQLSLTLRTEDGAADEALDQITLNDLLGVEAAPMPVARPQAPAPAARTVRERRGATNSNVVQLN